MISRINPCIYRYRHLYYLSLCFHLINIAFHDVCEFLCRFSDGFKLVLQISSSFLQIRYFGGDVELSAQQSLWFHSQRHFVFAQWWRNCKIAPNVTICWRASILHYLNNISVRMFFFRCTSSESQNNPVHTSRFDQTMSLFITIYWNVDQTYVNYNSFKIDVWGVA